MPNASLKLPPIVPLEVCGGDWEKYLALVYLKFQHDFVNSKPAFSKPVQLKRMPVFKDKEATFWHIIQEDLHDSNGKKNEADRVPSLRRCERIAWPRAIMEAYHRNDGSVLSWISRHGSEDRIQIVLLDFSYIVVVADRGDYVLPWTAYPIDHSHSREKFKKRYDDYQKSLAAAPKPSKKHGL
jgi:hypothetical protein